MRYSQFKPQLENPLRLLFEIGEITERCRWLDIGANFAGDVARGSHVVIVMSVDQIQNHFLSFGSGALLVNPAIDSFAGAFEQSPIVGFPVNAVPQDQIIQFPDIVLKMVGDSSKQLASYSDPSLPLAPRLIEAIAGFVADHAARR